MDGKGDKRMKSITNLRLLIISLIIGLLYPNHGLQAQSDAIPRLSPVPTDISGDKLIKLSLDGQWKFNAKFEDSFTSIQQPDSWSDIKVPGEWSMQGHVVDSAQPAAYFRTFSLPKDWKGQRIKLRFNAVYSLCEIFINGQKAGEHHGGFTAFELDITDLTKFNDENTLLLSVRNESLSNSLSSGSRYACHPLGGINRSVFIMALPVVNVSSLAVETSFEKDFVDADLITYVEISNENSNKVKDLSLSAELREWKNEDLIHLPDSQVDIQVIKSGGKEVLKLKMPVLKPKQWNCETPNLYVLTLKLKKNGEIIETIHQRFGFRQSEVKGNQLFVNGKPIKLRGVNRHEVYPLTGRVVPKEMYREDVELFREGNVNHIRTCHYPPDEELMEIADELGMFIECEGPFCWSHETKGDSVSIQKVMTSQLLEMIVLNRNHPSIIFWSISNESIWNKSYDIAGQAMKKLDPTRPLTFNYFPWGWVKNQQEDEAICALGSDHYPSPTGPGKYSDYRRPISFGEFVHLNAYNRFELASDVALRDKWGIYLHSMWEDMYKSQGVAGGSIWAGIDDTFYWDYPLDDGSIEERTVGYGTWGPIDGWRRKKPEWWGMKKTYSPIRIIDVEKKNNVVSFMVENRQDFSNLKRLRINWKIGQEKGLLYADIPPKQMDLLEINSKHPLKENAKLELEFIDPRGFTVDSFILPIHPQIISYKVPLNETSRMKIEEKEEYLLVTSNQEKYKISTATGLLYIKDLTGPRLMILPMNNGGETQMHGPTKYYEPFTPVCTDWKLDSVENLFYSKLEIKIHGTYKEANGSFIYKFRASGGISIEYDFVLNDDINPRQMGLVFDLPKKYENLYWKRKGYWSTYPDWHIARLEGKATASEGIESSPVGPRTKPDHEWRHDRTKIGSNDFASTKHNIYRASLRDASEKGFEVRSNAKLHSRSWIEEDEIHWLIANYSNGGSERFLRPHAKKDDKPLKKGDQISGKLILQSVNRKN